MRPAYFVVSLVEGREVPCVYHDELPRRPIRHLIYVVRLDLLPNAEALCAAPLHQLYDVFVHLRRRGKLPPRWEPPPRPKEGGSKVYAGHREVHPRRHLPDLPEEEPPVRQGGR